PPTSQPGTTPWPRWPPGTSTPTPRRPRRCTGWPPPPPEPWSSGGSHGPDPSGPPARPFGRVCAQHQEWPGDGASNLGRTHKVLSSAPAGGCGPARGNEVFGAHRPKVSAPGREPGDDVTPAPVGERATGAWLPGDPIGHRQMLHLGERGFVLEGGAVLHDVTIAYETWGTLNEDRSNAVLVCHALTGDSHAAGPLAPGHPTPGWWDAMIGPGKAIDTDRWFVVCANVLGG